MCIRDRPVLTSYRRGISETSVDLPLPVPPIMPSVLPSGSSRVKMCIRDRLNLSGV